MKTLARDLNSTQRECALDDAADLLMAAREIAVTTDHRDLLFILDMALVEIGRTAAAPQLRLVSGAGC
jgi:hypothetical protein